MEIQSYMQDVWAGVSAAPSVAAVLKPQRLKPSSAEVGTIGDELW